MSTSTLTFLVFLAAMTFVIGELCFFAYDISQSRKQLRRRVDLLPIGRWGRARAASAHTAERTAEVGLPTTLALKGGVLEFARRVAPWRIPATLARPLYLGLRVTAGVVAATALVLLSYRFASVRAMPTLVGLGVLGAGLGWLIPQLLMQRLAVLRRRAITRGLPEALELLVIAVEAGLSLEDAIGRIVVELRASQPAIATELAQTSADLRILPSRDEALSRLAARVDLPSVHSVVTTLSQALRYGTPLAQALHVVASELRDDALTTLEERANRMPVLLTIPMVVFILPSLFLIIGGPAFLKVLDTYIRMH